MLALWRAGGCGAGGVALRSAQHARKHRDESGSAHCPSRECHGIALAVAGASVP